MTSFGINYVSPVRLYTAPPEEGRLGPGERVGVWLSQGPLEKQSQSVIGRPEAIYYRHRLRPPWRPTCRLGS